MKNIKIIQYKEFKKEYQFNLFNEIAMLKHVEKISWNKDTQELAKKIKDNMLNTNRYQSEKDNSILFDYTLFLINYMKDRPKTFDIIYNYLTENKYNYMGIEILKELSHLTENNNKKANYINTKID